MDHAVSLVQAYLQLNGYFTSAEYPIMAAKRRGQFQTVTDIDILAFRFPPASSNGSGLVHGIELSEPDPGLDVPRDRIDMVIGEVKEGRVGINTGATDPAVLRAVVSRFGCSSTEIEEISTQLMHNGMVIMPSGYQIRLIAFGALPPVGEVPPCRIISLGHVLRFLQDYVRRNWAVLRHVQFKEPAFGFLMTLEKARRGGAGRRGQDGVEVVLPSSGPSARRGRPPGAAAVAPPMLSVSVDDTMRTNPLPVVTSPEIDPTEQPPRR